MPNYKLGTWYTAHLRDSARILVNKHTTCLRGGFPLTHDEVQLCGLDTHTLSLISALKDKNFNNVAKYPNIYLTVKTPAMKRFAKLRVSCATPWYMTTAYETAIASLDHLAPDRLDLLTKWCDANIRAERIEKMAFTTIDACLTESSLPGRGMSTRLPSTGHVQANWPMLANVASDKRLVDRLRTAPDKLKRYKWDAETEKYLRPRIKATDTILQMAQMLGTPVVSRGIVDVTATVLDWEKLPTDVYA